MKFSWVGESDSDLALCSCRHKATHTGRPVKTQEVQSIFAPCNIMVVDYILMRETNRKSSLLSSTAEQSFLCAEKSRMLIFYVCGYLKVIKFAFK